MIEVAFDSKLVHGFKGKEYSLLPVLGLQKQSIKGYIDFCLQVLHQSSQQMYIIVQEDKNLFSTNRLALAFFIGSCLTETNVQCVVFKTDNPKQSFENYKPYIALSIAIKYALRLAKLPSNIVYKELACLNYLQFSVKENFREQTIEFSPKDCEVNEVIETHSVFDALVYAALFKALSLANIRNKSKLKINLSKSTEDINPSKLIDQILKTVDKHIKI